MHAAALKEYDGDQAKASAAAWAAAEKAGWHKDKEGKWVKKERKNEEPSPMRLLSSPFMSVKNEKIEIDGDLLVKGVRMLASGTWTDSAVQTPLNYPASTLEKYAKNWTDTAGWTRHTGGFPRDATDKVAEIMNPRFEDGAVVADILIFGDTQKGRDMMAQVKKGRVKYVSVEHTGDERYNASTRQLEATSINFSGFAFVNKGACKLCRINEAAPLENVQDAPEPVVQVEPMETKELEAQTAVETPSQQAVDNSRELEQAEEIKALKADLEAMKSMRQELDALKVFKQEAESLRAELKEMKSQPAAAPVAAAAPVVEQKIEGTPALRVKFDKRERLITYQE